MAFVRRPSAAGVQPPRPSGRDADGDRPARRGREGAGFRYDEGREGEEEGKEPPPHLSIWFRSKTTTTTTTTTTLPSSLNLNDKQPSPPQLKTTAACSCRALRDATDDERAWSLALENALPGVNALIEASPPDWALFQRKPKSTKKSRSKNFSKDPNSPKTLRHPKLLLAALASGKEFSAQVFNRELDNEAEDFLLSCYDAKLSLERWRPSSGEEEEEVEEVEGEKEEEESAAAGVVTRARAATLLASAAAAAAAAAPSSSSSSPSPLGECPRSPRVTRRRRARPEEEKVNAAAAAAEVVAVAAVVASTSSAAKTAQPPKSKKKKNRGSSRVPPGLPLKGISPTYTAKYLPMGRSLAVETGVGAGRMRAAPKEEKKKEEKEESEALPLSSSSSEDVETETGTPPLSSSSDSFSLSPGDAVEVQWKATESHPYGSWLGCVVSVFSPEGSGTARATARATARVATATTATAARATTANDEGNNGEGARNASSSSNATAATVDILFQQYSFDSPWQIVYSVPLLPPVRKVFF